MYFKHFTSVNSHTGGRTTINNQLGVSKSPYTVGTFTDYSVTFNRIQESRINQVILSMEFSLEVVSIHQIVEPAPNMKVLLVWQNIDQICRIIIFCILHNYAAVPLWF